MFLLGTIIIQVKQDFFQIINWQKINRRIHSLDSYFKTRHANCYILICYYYMATSSIVISKSKGCVVTLNIKKEYKRTQYTLLMVMKLIQRFLCFTECIIKQFSVQFLRDQLIEIIAWNQWHVIELNCKVVLNFFVKIKLYFFLLYTLNLIYRNTLKRYIVIIWFKTEKFEYPSTSCQPKKKLFFSSSIIYNSICNSCAQSYHVSRYARTRALTRDYNGPTLINVIGVHPCVINSVLLTLENSLIYIKLQICGHSHTFK